MTIPRVQATIGRPECENLLRKPRGRVDDAAFDGIQAARMMEEIHHGGGPEQVAQTYQHTVAQQIASLQMTVDPGHDGQSIRPDHQPAPTSASTKPSPRAISGSIEALTCTKLASASSTVQSLAPEGDTRPAQATHRPCLQDPAPAHPDPVHPQLPAPGLPGQSGRLSRSGGIRRRARSRIVNSTHRWTLQSQETGAHNVCLPEQLDSDYQCSRGMAGGINLDQAGRRVFRGNRTSDPSRQKYPAAAGMLKLRST